MHPDRLSVLPMNFTSDEARELYFHATSDSGCYHAWILPAYQSLERKWKAGTFDRLKAMKLLTSYALVSVAKNYRLEHGSMTDSWSRMFPPHVRQEVSHYLTEYLVTELEVGNSYLPEARR